MGVGWDFFCLFPGSEKLTDPLLYPTPKQIGRFSCLYQSWCSCGKSSPLLPASAHSSAMLASTNIYSMQSSLFLSALYTGVLSILLLSKMCFITLEKKKKGLMAIGLGGSLGSGHSQFSLIYFHNYFQEINGLSTGSWGIISAIYLGTYLKWNKGIVTLDFIYL